MQQSAEATLEPEDPPPGGSARQRRFAWVVVDAPDKMRSRWPEWGTLFIYAALVAFAIPYHEPWVDEAQAWQLARNLSLASLFKTYIRYEGAPGLWHFLLWIMARIHIGYTGLHWICGAIAVAAMGLLLFRSPFPRYLKLSLPFTYFLLFQYAIVARNYVLAPLLLFLAAIAWRKNPFTLAVVLGLLANVSLHAAMISGGLAIIYAIEQVWNRQSKPFEGRRKFLLCGFLLFAFYAFAIWTAWPPRDLILSSVRGQPSIYLLRAIYSLVLPMCQPWIVSIPFWTAIALWFHARRKLYCLLPVMLFAAFSGAVSVAWWHAGLLIPLLICLLWITWRTPETGNRELEVAGRIALVVMVVTQLLWSGYVLFYDHYYAYSPDRAAAKFLSPFVRENASIAVTYISRVDDKRVRAYPAVGILPYFDHNIYANTPYPFWWWSDKDPTEDRFNALLPSHPRIVLVEETHKNPVAHVNLDNPKYVSLVKNGYRFVNSFCGSQPWQLEVGETLCHVVFEYSGQPGSSAIRDEGSPKDARRATGYSK
jgi:hypothetical protein